MYEEDGRPLAVAALRGLALRSETRPDVLLLTISPPICSFPLEKARSTRGLWRGPPVAPPDMLPTACASITMLGSRHGPPLRATAIWE